MVGFLQNFHGGILVSPLYTDSRYNDKIHYTDNLNVTNSLLKRWQLMRNYARICFWYLLESPHWGDSNKYPKHMFCQETRIKQGLSYISLCLLRILYNSKVILMATSLGTNAVVVTRLNCIQLGYNKELIRFGWPWHNFQDHSSRKTEFFFLPKNTDIFSDFSLKTYVVGTHNIHFHEEKNKKYNAHFF